MCLPAKALQNFTHHHSSSVLEYPNEKCFQSMELNLIFIKLFHKIKRKEIFNNICLNNNSATNFFLMKLMKHLHLSSLPLTLFRLGMWGG